MRVSLRRLCSAGGADKGNGASGGEVEHLLDLFPGDVEVIEDFLDWRTLEVFDDRRVGTPVPHYSSLAGWR